MNPLDFLFQEGTSPARGLATDRHLRNGFQRGARTLGAVLRLHTVSEEGISAGRYYRLGGRAEQIVANAPAIETLERELRLCPADWGSIANVADRSFGRPENFIVGIGKVRTIPDTIMRALG